MDHVKIWVSQADPDIFIVSETWLTDKTLYSEVAMDGYNVFRARCHRAAALVAGVWEEGGKELQTHSLTHHSQRHCKWLKTYLWRTSCTKSPACHRGKSKWFQTLFSNPLPLFCCPFSSSPHHTHCSPESPNFIPLLILSTGSWNLKLISGWTLTKTRLPTQWVCAWLQEEDMDQLTGTTVKWTTCSVIVQTFQESDTRHFHFIP